MLGYNRKHLFIAVGKRFEVTAFKGTGGSNLRRWNGKENSKGEPGGT